MTTTTATQGVLFFNHGTKHTARLVVSLYSLRQHYDGPAVILDTGSSGGIVEQIAADERLKVEVVRIPFKQYRRHSCYVMKSTLWRYSPFSKASLLVDSDTVFAGDPSPLLNVASDPAGPGLVVTQFSDWTTNGGSIVSSRVRQWLGVVIHGEPAGDENGIDAVTLARESLAEPWPAINTGVICWRNGVRFLSEWERLTVAGWQCGFCDELAAQLLLRKHRHMLVDDRYNCSYGFGVNKANAVIWHAHGSHHLRPEFQPIWLPIYRECCQLNIGGIRSWTPAGDKALTTFLAASVTT